MEDIIFDEKIFDENALKVRNFGNFLVVIPSKETSDVIEYMNE
jgi:hypothetical protein